MRSVKGDLYQRIVAVTSKAPCRESMAMLDLTVEQWIHVADALNDYEYRNQKNDQAYESAMGFANDSEPCVEGGFQC